MMHIDKAIKAWGTPEFSRILKQELIDQSAYLPLQEGLSTCNYVSDAPITPIIHSISELKDLIRVKAGIFYQGIIGGCSCSDDPTPTSEINEYCDIQLDIDKKDASVVVTLVND